MRADDDGGGLDRSPRACWACVGAAEWARTRHAGSRRHDVVRAVETSEQGAAKELDERKRELVLRERESERESPSRRVSSFLLSGVKGRLVSDNGVWCCKDRGGRVRASDSRRVLGELILMDV